MDGLGYGLGNRSNTDCSVWRPTVSPICASSAAAWIVVLINSAPAETGGSSARASGAAYPAAGTLRRGAVGGGSVRGGLAAAAGFAGRAAEGVPDRFAPDAAGVFARAVAGFAAGVRSARLVLRRTGRERGRLVSTSRSESCRLATRA